MGVVSKPWSRWITATAATTASMLWNVPSVTGQTTTPNGVPVDVIINISRDPGSGLVTFEQTGSVRLPTSGGPFFAQGSASPIFLTNVGIGLIQETPLDRYIVASNLARDCLSGASNIDVPLTAPGVPTLYGADGIFFVNDGFSSGSVTGTAVSASQVTMADIQLNECTTCIYEYDIDGNTNNGFEAAFVWNVGSNNGTPCPTESPSSSPSKSPRPSTQPSFSPSGTPSAKPSVQPSFRPSMQPSASPSAQPSFSPSMQPSFSPSAQPSFSPSAQPSTTPSVTPSAQPSFSPSAQPSTTPSITPSAQPSFSPSAQPSTTPSITPSAEPTMSNAPTFCLSRSTKSPGKGKGKGGKGRKMRKTTKTASPTACLETKSPGKGMMMMGGKGMMRAGKGKRDN